MNRLFLKLSESREEGDVLRLVYQIIEKVKGQQKAISFGVLCQYPLDNQSLVSEIFTADGGVVVITKERRCMVQWPRFTREQADRFDDILATRQKDERLSVVATPAPIMGQDLRMYEVLPQLVQGDFETWLIMQDLFTYRSSSLPFLPSVDRQMKIRRYIQQATGGDECLTSSDIYETINSFAAWFRRGDRKRKRPTAAAVLTEEQRVWKNQIINSLLMNKFIECFQLFSDFCQQSDAPCRVLQALQRKNSQIIADGCLFTVQFEPSVLCRYTVCKKKITVSAGPWTVIMLRDGTATQITAEGISTTGDALFMAKHSSLSVPQVQVWVNQQFVSPFLFWKFWRSTPKKNNVASSLVVFAKQVFAPVPIVTDAVSFLQLLWQNAADCISTTAVSS